MPIRVNHLAGSNTKKVNDSAENPYKIIETRKINTNVHDSARMVFCKSNGRCEVRWEGLSGNSIKNWFEINVSSVSRVPKWNKARTAAKRNWTINKFRFNQTFLFILSHWTNSQLIRFWYSLANGKLLDGTQKNSRKLVTWWSRLRPNNRKCQVDMKKDFNDAPSTKVFCVVRFYCVVAASFWLLLCYPGVMSHCSFSLIRSR